MARKSRTMESKYRQNITNEELNGLPLGRFEGEIVVVDDAGAAEAACAYLAVHRVIGFDTESRPAFSKGVVNKMALLQLSGGDKAFLFRLNRMALVKPILRIMEDESIVKAGAAIRDDLKGLQKFRRFTPRGFVELQAIVGDYGIEDKSLRKLAGIVLGVKISKAQRLSNWEAHTLTEAQQIYAATDAWIGRQIYIGLTGSL